MIIREILPEEVYKLEDMLYEAIFQPDKNNPIPRSVVEIPEVNVYIKDFGKRDDDYCFVADLDGKIIGAVWVRIIADEVKGYGYIDDYTPEFAISLFEEYRNKGIGTLLMLRMIDYLNNRGYKQTSLSVQKENYALKMYQRVGFTIIEEREHDYLMVLELR